MDTKLLTANEICELYRCSRATLYTRLARGEMPRPLKIGGRVLWRVVDVEAHIAGLTPHWPGAHG